MDKRTAEVIATITEDRDGQEEERQKECRRQCQCEEPLEGSSYYTCNYGFCCGYKCERCGCWIASQEAECYYPLNKEEGRGLNRNSQSLPKEEQP